MEEYAVYIDKGRGNKIYFVIGRRPRSVTTAELRFGGERKEREKERKRISFIEKKVIFMIRKEFMDDVLIWKCWGYGYAACDLSSCNVFVYF